MQLVISSFLERPCSCWLVQEDSQPMRRTAIRFNLRMCFQDLALPLFLFTYTVKRFILISPPASEPPCSPLSTPATSGRVFERCQDALKTDHSTPFHHHQSGTGARARCASTPFSSHRSAQSGHQNVR